MVNQEIITSLKNALNYGESLEQAMQILINSGYNAAEVQEASGFIGTGIQGMQQVKPEEELTMPRKKGFINPFVKSQTPKFVTVTHPNPPQQMPTPRTQQIPVPLQQQPAQYSQPQQKASETQIQRLIQPNPQTPQTRLPSPPTQPLSSTTPSPQFPKPPEYDRGLTEDIEKIKPIGESHAKEIILFIILLILITLLILSFVFKDKIIGMFSFLLGMI